MVKEEHVVPRNLCRGFPRLSFSSAGRTDVSSSDSLSVSANTTTQLFACDCDRDDDDDDDKNKITTEQSNTEVDGEKKKRHAGYSLRSAIEYGRKMGVVSTYVYCMLILI